MRVLLLHSRYLSGSMSGENRVVDDEQALLRDAGHEVASWTPSVRSGLGGMRAGSDAIWSRSAIREVRQLIEIHKPDVVHLHSLYPRLSPAVIRAVSTHGVPLVMTLHNFRLMCLPATYLRDGAICEDCAGRAPWRGVVRGCYRGSRVASGVLGLSLGVHRTLGTLNLVDQFLAVSRFVRDKYVEVGFDPARIALKSNFAYPTERRADVGGPVLFLGRISPEKGLETVIEALPDSLRLVVAGDGPDRERLEHQGSRGVSFLGEIDSSDVPGLLRSCRALVVPSRCYEGQPRVILEAFAAGVPVIASRIGGLPELIEHGVNGQLVDVSSLDAWRRALGLLADDAWIRRLGEGAFTTWARRFTPKAALAELETVYDAACAANRNTVR